MAQAGAAVLLAGAVAAYALLPVPGRVAAGPISNGPGRDAPPSAEPDVDFAATAEGLALFDIAKPREAEPVEPTQTADAGSGPAPAWKYLGAIVEPNRMVAIVSTPEGQRIMAPGAAHQGMRVEEVREQELVLSDDSGRHTIRREARKTVLGSTGGNTGLGAVDGMIEGEFEADDPRALDRRVPGAGRPAAPGGRNQPRAPKPAGGNAGRPRTPEGT